MLLGDFQVEMVIVSAGTTFVSLVAFEEASFAALTQKGAEGNVPLCS